MTLQQGLLYAFVPALVGAVVALAMLLLARQHAKLSAEAGQRFLVLLAMPAVGPILAFVGAFATQDAGEAARIPLLALGGAAALQGVGFGILGGRRVRDLEDPSHFSRMLIPLAALEVPTILAMMWVMQLVPAGAAA